MLLVRIAHLKMKCLEEESKSNPDSSNKFVAVFGIEKVNFPEHNLIYKKKAYLTVQKGENILYADYFILVQIIPVANAPAEVDGYECVLDKVRIIRLKELNKAIGLINAIGGQEKVSFNYGNC